VVKLKGGKGYATLKRTLPEKWLDARRWARARKGTTIG
jgi:hypothetical protein